MSWSITISHAHLWDIIAPVVWKSDFFDWPWQSMKRLLKRPNRVWKVISIFPELFVFLALSCEAGLVPPPPFGCEAARRRTERERVRELLGAAGMPELGLTQAETLDDVGSERVFCASRAAGFWALKPPPRFHLSLLLHLRFLSPSLHAPYRCHISLPAESKPILWLSLIHPHIKSVEWSI